MPSPLIGVLTTSVVGLGLASAVAVRSGTSALGSDIQTTLTEASVAALDFSSDTTNGVDPDQCPDGWAGQVEQAYGTSAGDLIGDYEYYVSFSDEALMTSYAYYTDNDGARISRNEDNGQTGICALSARAISVDTRVL